VEVEPPAPAATCAYEIFFAFGLGSSEGDVPIGGASRRGGGRKRPPEKSILCLLACAVGKIAKHGGNDCRYCTPKKSAIQNDLHDYFFFFDNL